MNDLLNRTIKIAPDVLSQHVSGETVILDINSECYFGLDEIGTLVWQAIRDNGRLNEVFDRILEQYEVEQDQLEKDLNEIINKLHDAGLVEISDM